MQKSIVMFVSAVVLTEVAVGDPQPGLERRASDVLSAGFNADICSAYVYRNAVYNDELVFQPSVWMDITLFDLVQVGGSVWQNWNLTNRQGADGTPNEMNETDYNLHVAGNLWESDDERYSLRLAFAHEWETYRDDRGSNELSLRLDFENPFVGVYGQYAQAYWPESACHFELGLAREWNVGDLLEKESDWAKRLIIGFDWNVNFGSSRFLTKYSYGPLGRGADDSESEGYEDREGISGGIGGTTIMGALAYEVCEHFTVCLALAFTSTLSRDAREYIDQTYCDTYRDLVWGGLQAKLEF